MKKMIYIVPASEEIAFCEEVSLLKDSGVGGHGQGPDWGLAKDHDGQWSDEESGSDESGTGTSHQPDPWSTWE